MPTFTRLWSCLKSLKCTVWFCEVPSQQAPSYGHVLLHDIIFCVAKCCVELMTLESSITRVLNHLLLKVVICPLANCSSVIGCFFTPCHLPDTACNYKSNTHAQQSTYVTVTSSTVCARSMFTAVAYHPREPATATTTTPQDSGNDDSRFPTDCTPFGDI